MPANTNPIYTLVPNTAWTTMTAANTVMDGSGTVGTIFTAGANGGYISRVIMRSLGTNVATVMRVFLNNGSTNATAANNSLLTELAVGTTSASNVLQQPEYALQVDIAIPAGYKLLVTLGTAVAAGYAIAAIGGDY